MFIIMDKFSSIQSRLYDNNVAPSLVGDTNELHLDGLTTWHVIWIGLKSY